MNNKLEAFGRELGRISNGWEIEQDYDQLGQLKTTYQDIKREYTVKIEQNPDQAPKDFVIVEDMTTTISPKALLDDILIHIEVPKRLRQNAHSAQGIDGYLNFIAHNLSKDFVGLQAFQALHRGLKLTYKPAVIDDLPEVSQGGKPAKQTGRRSTGYLLLTAVGVLGLSASIVLGQWDVANAWLAQSASQLPFNLGVSEIVLGAAVVSGLSVVMGLALFYFSSKKSSKKVAAQPNEHKASETSRHANGSATEAPRFRVDFVALESDVRQPRHSKAAQIGWGEDLSLSFLHFEP